MKTTKSAVAAQMPTARTAEQQAALDTMRANKEAEALAAVTPPVVELTTEEKMEAQLEKALSYLKSTFASTGEDMPSWKRQLAAFFGSIVLAGGTGYLVGQVAGWMMLGCFALTGSIFMTYLVMLGAILLSAYAGLKIAERVGNYVLSGQVDRDFIKAKTFVTGFFEPKQDIVAI